jgi:hypothetical protein
MKSLRFWASVAGLGLVASVGLAQSPRCRVHDDPALSLDSSAPVQEAGDPFGVMRRDRTGFVNARANQHFRLTETGGLIEAQVNDPADSAGRDRIRTHFARIAKMFSEGNFPAPIRTQQRVPPGAPEMKKSRTAIHYELEPTDRGGRVVITTTDERALGAIHEFLRFQIQDHRTGDSLEIRRESGAAKPEVQQAVR